MKEDRDLSLRMETRLIERAKGGPNADPPVSERTVPRVSRLKGCPRETYYWLIGAPEDPLDALGACAFQDGKDFEAGILADFAKAAGLHCAKRQVPVSTPWFKGSADFVVDGMVLDAKSANPASFDITVKRGEVGEQYVAQLSLYAVGLGATECVIVYRQKGGTRKGNPQVYAVFRFPPDLALVEKLKAQAVQAMDARDGYAPVPDRAYRQSDWRCQYCSFRTHCWGGA